MVWPLTVPATVAVPLLQAVLPPPAVGMMKKASAPKASHYSACRAPALQGRGAERIIGGSQGELHRSVTCAFCPNKCPRLLHRKRAEGQSSPARERSRPSPTTGWLQVVGRADALRIAEPSPSFPVLKRPYFMQIAWCGRGCASTGWNDAPVTQSAALPM